jgi:eukaryotic-like serine/threonine-protein kinase
MDSIPPTGWAHAMQQVGRYEIIDELGRGAMGVVYRARDTEIGRDVALKLILTANTPPVDVDHYKQRFRREAQAAGRLSHPGIVTIHDIAEDDSGQPYLVMEFIEGRSLSQLLDSPAQLPLDQSLDIGIQVAHALDYAHGKGVVHRDIKPANILITPAGRAKIADFGIAKLIGTDLTKEGTSLGTPSYMSPEQFRGEAVDARSDQFSLGAVLFRMCAGRTPFSGDSVTAISFQVVFQAPPRASELNSSLPVGLDLILSRCLAKDPAERYANCAELAADLEAIRAGRPVRDRLPPVAERTAAIPVTPPPPAPARVANHADQTQPSHADADRTRLASAELPGAAAAQTGAAARRWLPGAAAALLVALAGGGYWLWHARVTSPPAAPQTVAPQPTATQPAATPSSAAPLETSQPQPAVAQPVPSAVRESKDAAPAATATLHISCKHNFRSAILEIYSDDQLLLKTALSGKEHNYKLVKVYEGKLDVDQPIAAGSHSLRVRVTSHHDHYDDQEVVSGTFSSGDSRTLEIAFGRGSGLPMVGRNLDLTLQ